MVLEYRHQWVLFGLVVLLTTACDSKSQDNSNRRMAPATTAVNGKVYMIGGLTPSVEVSGAVQEYDPQMQEWSFRSNMPTARTNGAAVATVGRIFLFGGRNEDNSDGLSATESFDPVSNQWTEHSPMPTGRWNLMAVAIQDRIYTFGGIVGTGNQRRVLDVVEVYDIQADEWNVLQSMPSARSTGRTVAIRDQIYLLGGRTGTGQTPSATREVDVYDSMTGLWSKAASISNDRSDPAACGTEGTIFLAGGAGGGDVHASMEIYDASLDQWSPGPKLASRRGNASCAVIGDDLLLFGGFTAPDFSSLLGTVEVYPLSTM